MKFIVVTLQVHCRMLCRIVSAAINTQVNSALHPSGVAKSSTSFGWGKGGKVTSAGWQVTLCDLIWHVISRSGVVISITNCCIWFTVLYFTLLYSPLRNRSQGLWCWEGTDKPCITDLGVTRLWNGDKCWAAVATAVRCVSGKLRLSQQQDELKNYIVKCILYEGSNVNC